MSNTQHKLSDILKFLIPSLIGIFLFVTPITQGGSITIPVALLSGWLQDTLANAIPFIVTGIIIISFVGALLFKLLHNHSDAVTNEHSSFWGEIIDTVFNISPLWIVIRGLGCVFAIATLFEVGPAFIYNPDTGGLVFYDLLPVLFSIFLFASIFLPLLLDFGLLEFIGSILVKVMRPVFKLPGRAAIDCIASWLGDGTVGILLTSKQYEQGYYTEKEASIIGTTFSLVSITFTLVIIDTVGLSHMFVPFYLTVTVACLVAAIVLPKFGPLKNKRDTLIDGQAPKISENETTLSLRDGFDLAVNKASSQQVVNKICLGGLKNLIDMWFAVIPVVMGVATIALIIAEFTPVFTILGLPFFPILYILQIPEAMAASSTLMSGFADMLLPSIMAVSIESEMTRFVVACVSVSQLIYLSEVGAVLLASKIPLSFKELFIIFVQRTLITLPIIALFAHIIF